MWHKNLERLSPVHNTQYKTVGVQWFARVWFSLQHSCRWTTTKPANPTVSYCQTLALLAMKRLGTSKHSGAIGLFDKEFVKSGIFSKQLSKSLHLTFDYRQTHDYGEIIEIEKDTAKKVLEDSKEFVKEVESYLKSQGYI